MCFTTFLAQNRLVVVRRRPEGSAADSHAGRAAKCRVIKGEKELQVPDSQVEQKSNFNDYCWLFKSVLLFVLALCGNRFQCASVVVLITVHPIVPSFFQRAIYDRQLSSRRPFTPATWFGMHTLCVTNFNDIQHTSQFISNRACSPQACSD